MKRFFAGLAVVGLLAFVPAVPAHAARGERHEHGERHGRREVHRGGGFWPGFALGAFLRYSAPAPVYVGPPPSSCYPLQGYWTPDGYGGWQWVPGQTVCQ